MVVFIMYRNVVINRSMTVTHLEMAAALNCVVYVIFSVSNRFLHIIAESEPRRYGR